MVQQISMASEEARISAFCFSGAECLGIERGMAKIKQLLEEKNMDGQLKKLLSITPLKITIFIILLALVLFFLDIPFLRFMELKSLDLRMLSRGPVPSGGETVIAVIDEKSVSELGRWPWPRTTIAKLIDTLKSYGAKAVGFDVVFAEPGDNSSLKTISSLSSEIKRLGIQNPGLSRLLAGKKMFADTDAVLARSIKKAANVTLGYFFHTSQEEVAHLTAAEIEAEIENISGSQYPFVEAKETPDDSLLISAYAAVPSIKLLSEAAENCGYFNAFPDSDGVIRWSPLVIKFQDGYYCSLALSLLMQYLNWPMLCVQMASYGVEGVQIGDILVPTDETGRLLINYLGPAKTFPHYSISDIIQRRLPADYFRNKMVIVGATATGIYDLRVTPFSAVYPGVEIHANVIDNILHQNFLEQSGCTVFLDICSIVLLGLVIGLALPRLKAVRGMLLSLFMMVLYVSVNVFLFTHFKMWLNIVYPVLTMLTIYFGITVYRYMTEEKEKKKIRGAFQHYLTASVINEMLRDPSKLKLGGDKKELSVLFSDIRGFTTVSESLTPEELVCLLNEYLTAMTDVVFKYSGLLDKYIGDAVMAVFGAPVNQPDHALRASKTALDMMSELRRLQKKWAGEGRPVLNIGVGVNSGDMVVGNMGSEMRFDYTVMGDSVNLGSRLEGLNKEYGTNIIISESTYLAVKDELFCRELDAVRVKGKLHPIKIYELLCEKKDSAPFESFVKLFEEALAKYKQGLWDEAIGAFQKVLEVKLGDPPSLLYIRRCQELKEHPPEGTWDGVYTMTKK
jgi:adenylate cyclase